MRGSKKCENPPDKIPPSLKYLSDDAPLSRNATALQRE